MKSVPVPPTNAVVSPRSSGSSSRSAGTSSRAQHYAFLVSEDEFDAIFARIQERDKPYWADRGRRQPGESTVVTADQASTSRTHPATTSRS